MINMPPFPVGLGVCVLPADRAAFPLVQEHLVTLFERDPVFLFEHSPARSFTTCGGFPPTFFGLPSLRTSGRGLKISPFLLSFAQPSYRIEVPPFITKTLQLALFLDCPERGWNDIVGWKRKVYRDPSCNGVRCVLCFSERVFLFTIATVPPGLALPAQLTFFLGGTHPTLNY